MMTSLALDSVTAFILLSILKAAAAIAVSLIIAEAPACFWERPFVVLVTYVFSYNCKPFTNYNEVT